MRRLLAGVLGVALALASASGALAAPASADVTVAPASAATPTGQAADLCANSPRSCQLRTEVSMREGGAYQVTVVGNPQTRVQVVVYRPIVRDGVLIGLAAISTGGDVQTNNDGVGQTQVSVRKLDDTASNGWVLVSLAGLTGADLGGAMGQWVPFGARTPTLLGDGYAEAKPAGATLELQVVGVIPGTRFAVTYQDDSGAWLDATTAQRWADSSNQASIVGYTVPRGLTNTPHQARLVNLTDVAVIDFTFTPDATGQPQDVTPIFVPPAVGIPSGADATTGFPRAAATTVLGVIALGGLLVLSLGVPALASRRRGVGRA